MTTTKKKGPTFLYRYFDEYGVLLYVGVSVVAITRLGQHREEKEWFCDVRRIELEPFATRASALRAEARAIRTEAPVHNKAGVYIPKFKPTIRRRLFQDDERVYPQPFAAALRVGLAYIDDVVCSGAIPVEADEQRRIYCLGRDANAWIAAQE